MRVFVLALGILAVTACETVPQGVCKSNYDTMMSAKDREDETGFVQAAFAYNDCQADSGSKEAYLWLGEQYEKGNLITDVDLEEAFNNYYKAASDETTLASAAGSSGVSMNSQEQSVTNGLAEAQYRIGLMYEAGHGTDQSMTDATEWINRAAEQGHEGAVVWLAAHEG